MSISHKKPRAERFRQGHQGDKTSRPRAAVQRVMTAVFALSVVLAVAGFVLISTTPLEAATVTNTDTRDYELIIQGGEPKKTLRIPHATRVENVCPSGCVVRLNGPKGDEYRIEGNERLSIEAGALYYDGEISKSTKQSPQDAKSAASPAGEPMNKSPP